MPNVTLKQFRDTVQTGFRGGDASVLDGEIWLKKNNKGKTELVKTNFGGDVRRFFSTNASKVLTCTGDAEDNFNARQALLKALDIDFTTKAAEYKEQPNSANNPFDATTKARKNLMEWAKNILHISLDDKFIKGMEVPPLDRRTIKRILTGYDKVIKSENANYEIENAEDNWGVIDKKKKTFDHLSLTKDQFNDMMDRSLKEALKSIPNDADQRFRARQTRNYTEAANVIKKWFTEVEYKKHATTKQKEQQNDGVKFFFEDMLKGTLDVQTIALYIKALAMKQHPLTLKHSLEGDQPARIPIYQENMSIKLNARKDAIAGGALNFHNKVNVCLGAAKNSKANPLGGKQNVLDLVADLFANKDLGTFGQGNLTDGLRLVKTFANHYQLFGKLVKNATKDLADVTDSDVKFFYEVLDDLGKDLKKALSDFFKEAHEIFHPDQANNQIDNLINNNNTSSSDTIDLIAAHVDDLATAACKAQLEQAIDGVAQTNVAIFGNMVADNILSSDKQNDENQYQQIDNAKQDYKTVKSVFDANQGGYEHFAQQLLKKYVNEISGSAADAGAVTDCRLIIANAIRTSKQLSPQNSSEQLPLLEEPDDEPILIQTEDEKDNIEDKKEDGMGEKFAEEEINIQINTSDWDPKEDNNTISTTRRKPQEQKAGVKQKVIQYEGFLKGLGPSIVKLLQAVSTEKVKASDQKNPGNVAKYGSLETALRGLKDDLPQISQDVIEAELNNVINTHNTNFQDGQTKKLVDGKTIRKIESIKVECALGCASVGEAVKAKINYVTGDSEDVVIKFIRPEVENRFKRERKILKDLLASSGNNKGTMQSHLQNWSDRLDTCEQELELNTEGANIEQGNLNYDDVHDRDALFKTTKVALKTGSKTCLIMSYDGDKTLSQECKSVRDLVAQEKEIDTKIASRITKPEKPDAPTLEELTRQHVERNTALGNLPEGKQFKADVENKVRNLRQASKALKKLSQTWMSKAFGDNSFYHADLHSGNILIKDGKLTLIDFGNVGKTNGQDNNAQKKVSTLLSKLMAMCSPDHKIAGIQELHATLKMKGPEYFNLKKNTCAKYGVSVLQNFNGVEGVDDLYSDRIDPELPDVFLNGYLDLMTNGAGKTRLQEEMADSTKGALLRTMLYKIFETRGSAFEKFTLAISFMQSKDYPIPADLFNFLEAGQRLRNSVEEVQNALQDLKAICIKYKIDVGPLDVKQADPNAPVRKMPLNETTCKDIEFFDDWSFEKEITGSLPDDQKNDKEVNDAKKASAMVKIMAGKYYFDHNGIADNCNLPEIEAAMTKLVLSEMLTSYRSKENEVVTPDSFKKLSGLEGTEHFSMFEQLSEFEQLSVLIQDKKIHKYGKLPLGDFGALDISQWDWWDSSSCWVNATAPLKYDDYALAIETNKGHRKNHAAAIKGLETELENCKKYKTYIFPKQPEADTLYRNQQTGRNVQLLKNYCKMRANSLKSLDNEKDTAAKNNAIMAWKKFDKEVFTTIDVNDIKRSVVGQDDHGGTDQAALKLNEYTDTEMTFKTTKTTRYGIWAHASFDNASQNIEAKLKAIPGKLEAISNKVNSNQGLSQNDANTLEDLARHLDGLDERYRNMYGVKSEVYPL